MCVVEPRCDGWKAAVLSCALASGLLSLRGGEQCPLGAEFELGISAGLSGAALVL